MITLVMSCTACGTLLTSTRISEHALIYRAELLGWEHKGTYDKCPACIQKDAQEMLRRVRPLDGLAASNAMAADWQIP